MTDIHTQLDLKQVLGAMLFGANRPISVHEMRRVFIKVKDLNTDSSTAFLDVAESDIQRALEQLKIELIQQRLGIQLVEVAGGYQLKSDSQCGLWIRNLLDIHRTVQLSHPALETLAIIAYRQPVTRSEIEAIRGVNVDGIVRHLLEMQLIRILTRSDLPGHPMLYGTTPLFLEHFGLKTLDNLPCSDELKRKEDIFVKKAESSFKRREVEK